MRFRIHNDCVVFSVWITQGCYTLNHNKGQAFTRIGRNTQFAPAFGTLGFPFIASPRALMKRSSPSFNPSYIIKTIPNPDKSHSRVQGQNRERCPSDVGNTYITVPVYKTNEKFTKKQIKDASTMYSICGTSSHSFVLALKSDPSIHIAVPYYRTCESTLGGKQFVTVSNFFPLSTVQATPPPGVNV